MLAEIRTKSQITIPKDIITSLGLAEGDKVEIYQKDGEIRIVPVVVYPKKYIDELQQEIEEVKADIANGKQPVFSSIDALFDFLEND